MAMCGHLAELCLFDLEQMDEAEHLVYHLPHLMPFLVFSTGFVPSPFENTSAN